MLEWHPCTNCTAGNLAGVHFILQHGSGAADGVPSAGVCTFGMQCSLLILFRISSSWYHACSMTLHVQQRTWMSKATSRPEGPTACASHLQSWPLPQVASTTVSPGRTKAAPDGMRHICHAATFQQQPLKL